MLELSNPAAAHIHAISDSAVVDADHRSPAFRGRLLCTLQSVKVMTNLPCSLLIDRLPLLSISPFESLPSSRRHPGRGSCAHFGQSSFTILRATDRDTNHWYGSFDTLIAGNTFPSISTYSRLLMDHSITVVEMDIPGRPPDVTRVHDACHSGSQHTVRRYTGHVVRRRRPGASMPILFSSYGV